MKRNKIKPKYLKIIDNQKKEEKNSKSEPNIFDKFEKLIINTLISLGLILLLLVWSYIPMTILALFNINYTNFSEFGKIIYMLICDILLLLILIKIYHKDFFQNFHDYFHHNFKENLKTSLRYWGIGIVIMIISNLIITILTNGRIATNEEAVRELIQISPLYMAFELIIYAPISEELIFRKSIYNITKNRYIYILLSGLIFGGLHAISSFNSLIDLLYLIPYCALGFTFAALYSKTNNIFSTITIHSIHNTLALILYLITL